MTHQAALRVVVRMQYDPIFADAVYRDPVATLLPLGLGERERGWLLAVDRRAFRHDPMKRRRTLHALVSEFKAAAALALLETRRVGFLDAFFASPEFHRAIQERGSLAAAFADYLLGARLRTPQLGDVVRLEATLARCRRELAAAGGPDFAPPPIPPGGPTHIARAPGVAVGSFSPDALAAIQAVEHWLFERSLMPIVALADDAPALELPAPALAPPVRLGIVPTQAGISLVELEPALYDAISRVDGPSVPAQRIGRALAASLCEDEVLIAVPAPE
ncbi:MAG TPA: hypothetical protein VKN99_13330 [Polyangia bacterium]|nr:hypothetical protein [Polyangia bacterium]